MAVFKRSYRQYDGPVTPLWSRFLILPRYAFKNVFRSRLLLVFYVLCFVPTLVFGAFIYLRHNATFLEVFELLPRDFMPVDANFFFIYLSFQASLAFIVTAFIGPGLISPDLANNALPLYLCRPFSRAEYVLGKMSVLIILISAVTWIPGLILIFMQTNYAGLSWLSANLRIPVAILLSSWLWIFVISLLALSLSAWVKWRVIAGIGLFIIFFVLAGFGNTINLILDTRWGTLIDLSQLITNIMHFLFMGEGLSGSIPVWSASISLAVLCAICLRLLNRRLQAYEVVR